MNYDEAIHYLYDQRLFGMKLGLANAFRLAAAAGNPQENLRFIHVAGTNGKGSTCAMLEGIYREAGLQVGLFTSPHLVSFSERIQINRVPISADEIVRQVEFIRDSIDAFDPGADLGAPTFFEISTIIALRYFAAERCDLVIWETGMGGRLDATNIVMPLASVITNIQLDHQKWLGHTIPEIAREKAGIIKPGVPVITGADDPAALAVIQAVSNRGSSPLKIVGNENPAAQPLELGLTGAHQQKNAAVARAVVETLQPQIPVPQNAIRRGLKNVRWSGRLERIRRGAQTVLLDGAHNPAGAETLAAALRNDPAGRPAIILATLQDKDYAEMTRILAPLASKLVLAPVGSERSADPASLLECCRAVCPDTPATATDSLAAALEETGAEPFVVIAGSLHLIGEAMELLGLAQGRSERSLNEYGAGAKMR
jgi:dihydrofolate synthase/folylpolyglutamate synthase